MAMQQPHDPLWKRFPGSAHSQLVGLGREGAPTIGIGAYRCGSCDEPHVVVAAVIYDVETDIFLTPHNAREIAAALIEQANRVDAGGVN